MLHVHAESGGAQNDSLGSCNLWSLKIHVNCTSNVFQHALQDMTKKWSPIAIELQSVRGAPCIEGLARVLFGKVLHLSDARDVKFAHNHPSSLSPRHWSYF